MNLEIRPRDTYTEHKQNACRTYKPTVAGQKPFRNEKEREEKSGADHRVTTWEGVPGRNAEPVEQVRAQTSYQYLRREVQAERTGDAQGEKHRRPPAELPEQGSYTQAHRSQQVDGTYDI